MALTTDPLALLDDDVRRKLSERGAQYYKELLQAILEPEQNGKGLAIHPDTGEYVVADHTTLAGRAMGERYPEGGFVVMKIGPEPDYALAARYLAGKQMRDGTQGLNSDCST